MSSQAEFAAILKLSPLFSDLGSAQLQRIAALCQTRHLAAGDVLFARGDAGDALFGVCRGQISIETADDMPSLPKVLGPGDLFGEDAVLDAEAQRATAVANDATELFVLSRRDFMAHLEREPRVAIRMIALLCRRMRWMSERIEEAVLQPLPVRLARRLCTLAADVGPEVHISQEQLGVSVGAARESVNRQLQAWRRDGLLDLHRGRIRLRDNARLTEIAQSR